MTPTAHRTHARAHRTPAHRTPAHPGRLLWHCAAAVTCALLAAACGSTAAPGPGSPPARPAGGPGTSEPTASSSGPVTAAAAKISLSVTISATAASPAAHYTLRCDPAGGTVRDPAAACARLLAGPSLFGPLPAHVACPAIMANAGRATVTGTFLGAPVHETIVAGGCDISRWAKLKQVLG